MAIVFVTLTLLYQGVLEDYYSLAVHFNYIFRYITDNVNADMDDFFSNYNSCVVYKHLKVSEFCILCSGYIAYKAVVQI